MTSRIIVNNIQSDAGISTIFFNSDIGATSGTLNLAGNLNVSGVVTYEDVTNIDSVGVITARSGIHVTGGSIGIGTVSPSGPVHAHTASGTQRSYLEASASHSFLRLKSGSTSYNSGVEFFSGASNIANVNALGAGGLQFEVNGGERLRITSTGKCEVYKGTSTTGKTSGSEAFTVGNGANNKRFSVYPDGSTVIGGQGTIGNYNILLQNDGQSYFGARMKIGTTTEGEANADDLTVATSGHTGMTIRSGTANRGNIYFSDGTSGDAEYRGYVTYDHDGDKLKFGTANYDRLHITSGGNIGIGINNPAYELEVASSDTTTFNITAGGNTNLSRLFFSDDDAVARGYLNYDHQADNLLIATAGSEKLRIDSSGRVLIDDAATAGPMETFGSAVLQVATTAGGTLVLGRNDSSVSTDNGIGSIYFDVNDSSGNAWNETARITVNADGDHANNDYPSRMEFYTTGDGEATPTERLRIRSDGKLTVTPADTTSSYATTDGGIDIAQIISSTGTSDSQSIGIQFSLTKSGQTGAIAEIGAIREGSGLSGLVFRTRDNSTGRNERLRINSVGELLIGETSSPVDEGISGATRCKIGMSFGNSTGNYIEMGGTSRTANGFSKLAVMRHGYWGGQREVGSIGFLTSSSSGGAGRGTGNFLIYTGSSGNGDGGNSGDNLSIERVRVGSSGLFYVNTTASNNWSQTNNGPNNDNANGNNPSGNMCFRTSEGALVIANDADSGYSAIYINKYEWNSGDDNRWINFYLNGTGKDSINWNGSNIIYGNNSDYRIKTNIRSYTGGIDLVKQIQVRQYDYIETERGTDHVGFIAHELQEVIPDAVSGEKDAMRTEEETGEEVMDIQNVDYGRVTPILTAALKEAIAKIETLEARIAALEGS